MKIINIGNTCYINAEEISSILELDSTTKKGYIQRLDSKGLSVDATFSRRPPRTAIVMKGGYVLYSEFRYDTILKRLDETDKE